MEFDNVGLLVGDTESTAKKTLLSLDITSGVIDEAAALGCELIVSHHPLIFSVKTVNNLTVSGRSLMALLSRGISAICMHTNLDAAPGGVNDALAAACGIADPHILAAEGRYADGREFSYGREGFLAAPTPLHKYLSQLKKSLDCNGLRYYDSGRAVFRVSVVGGSGGDYLERAKDSGCDTLVTGEAKYSAFLLAAELGVNLIDADHFCTENTVIPALQSRLSAHFPGSEFVISKTHGQTASFFV
jgi:dinuclear metal center YbgI/SA1388 family protein